MNGPKNTDFADRLSAAANAKKAQLERAARAGQRLWNCQPGIWVDLARSPGSRYTIVWFTSVY